MVVQRSIQIRVVGLGIIRYILHPCVLSCFNMRHGMHERITHYIDEAGEVYTVNESLVVILLAVLCAEALVDEIGQSTSCSKATG